MATSRSETVGSLTPSIKVCRNQARVRRANDTRGLPWFCRRICASFLCSTRKWVKMPWRDDQAAKSNCPGLRGGSILFSGATQPNFVAIGRWRSRPFDLKQERRREFGALHDVVAKRGLRGWSFPRERHAVRWQRFRAPRPADFWRPATLQTARPEIRRSSTNEAWRTRTP